MGNSVILQARAHIISPSVEFVSPVELQGSSTLQQRNYNSKTL
jgi:hypothetical protein